jgi:hypothetical protein
VIPAPGMTFNGKLAVFQNYGDGGMMMSESGENYGTCGSDAMAVNGTSDRNGFLRVFYPIQSAK